MNNTIKFKDIAYIMFVISMLFSNFYNNYINQLRFEKMESNFLHVLKTNQEKFDRIQEMNLRMFKYILNKQTKKTSVVENTTQTNPLLSESTQNNITTFISDNSTTILAVSAVLLAIVVYCYWQAPINAWLFSFFNNKPKDDDNKGDGGGSSDIGGNNNGGGSSSIGGNNDLDSRGGGSSYVAGNNNIGKCSSNAIIPYDELNLNINQKYSEQSLSLQTQINLDTNQNYPKEFSDMEEIMALVKLNDFFTTSNSNEEILRIDLDLFLKLFPQVTIKDGIPFIRCTDNTEVPLSQIDSLELLFDNTTKRETSIPFSNYKQNPFVQKDYKALAKDPTSDIFERDIGKFLSTLNEEIPKMRSDPSYRNSDPLSDEEFRELVDSYDLNDMEKTMTYIQKRIDMFDEAKKLTQFMNPNPLSDEKFVIRLDRMANNYDLNDIEKSRAFIQKELDMYQAAKIIAEFKEESSTQGTNQIPTEKSNETIETISTVISDIVEIICKEN